MLDSSRMRSTKGNPTIPSQIKETRVGCKMVESETWETNAPLDAFVIGLKELPEGTSPLKHNHIFFAHCFKEQTGWKELIKRFTDGKGTILDLEFLQDDSGTQTPSPILTFSGRRVAAFGYHAGFTGSAVGIDVWCHNTDPALGYFPLPQLN